MANIPSLPWNNRIAVILTVLEQQICVWMHNCYSHSENSGYYAIPIPSKHILRVRLANQEITLEEW
jgi:hypothetical protein